MAIHARAVPYPYKVIFFHTRRHQERFVHWRPYFFSNYVGEGKLLQGAAFARLQPQDLQIVRTGHEYDLLRFAVTAAFWSRADKELIAAPLSFVLTAVECKFELVYVVRQTVRGRHLCHRAMKRRVPARIIPGMTRAAGVRAHITGDLRFDGTIVRRLRCAVKIIKRNQSQAACACYRCDNQQPMAPGSRQLWHNFSCNIMEIEMQRQTCILFSCPPQEGHRNRRAQ